jgi:hypothetical protein
MVARDGGLLPKKDPYTLFTCGKNSIDDRKRLTVAIWVRFKAWIASCARKLMSVPHPREGHDAIPDRL